ncbi:hypothetical protein J4536_23460, partial [Escherichia coli]|nr:hypothetical protein [Escherichia coli]
MTNSTQKKTGQLPGAGRDLVIRGNKVDVDSPASASNSERHGLLSQPKPATGKGGVGLVGACNIKKKHNNNTTRKEQVAKNKRIKKRERRV